MTEPHESDSSVAETTPFFSVVTIAYNDLSGLEATETSLFKQDSGDYEWIVVDGGSTDGTHEYLRTIRDPRLRASSGPDHGIYDAMQKGLDRSTGTYVIFMNAGDIFATDDVLTRVRSAIGAQRPVLVYGDSWESDGVRRFYKPARAPSENAYVMFTHHQAIFYRRDVALKVGFDQSYRLSCDWVMTGRVLAAAGENVRYVAAPICAFARGGISQSTSARAVMNRELFRIYRHEHAHALPKAVTLWLKKLAVNKARSLMPRVYDRLRYPSGRPERSETP